MLYNFVIAVFPSEGSPGGSQSSVAGDSLLPEFLNFAASPIHVTSGSEGGKKHFV